MLGQGGGSSAPRAVAFRTELAEVAADALLCFHGDRIPESTMVPALSFYLRERVIAAIEAGASCGRAAERFGVAKASAICWHAGTGPRVRSRRSIPLLPMSRHHPSR